MRDRFKLLTISIFNLVKVNAENRQSNAEIYLPTGYRFTVTVQQPLCLCPLECELKASQSFSVPIQLLVSWVLAPCIDLTINEYWFNFIKASCHARFIRTLIRKRKITDFLDQNTKYQLYDVITWCEPRHSE